LTQPLITRAQASRFVLRRQHLLDPCSDPMQAVHDACGLQAQIPTSPAMQLRARVKGFTRADYGRLLVEERRLVRTWAMRFTVHVLPADQLAMYTQVFETPGRVQEAAELALKLLASGPQSRSQLAHRAVTELGIPAERARELFGPWGGVLQHLARMGLILHMPAPGTDVPFVRTADWLGAPPVDVPVESLEDALLRAYVYGYAPVSVKDFMHFTSFKAPRARAAFQRAGYLTAVRMEGSKLPYYVPAELLPELLLTRGDEPAPVRLLPRFDPLVLAYSDKTRILPADRRTDVFRPAAVVEAVALINGSVGGTWRVQTTTKELRFSFFPFGRQPLKTVETEAERLAKWLGLKQLAFSVGE